MDEDARPPIAPKDHQGAPVAGLGSPPSPESGGSGTGSATLVPPSRQTLVVPPRAARPLITVLGAGVCASAGFGLVWWMGFGRSPDTKLPVHAVAMADATGERAAAAGQPVPEPGRFRSRRSDEDMPTIGTSASPESPPFAAPTTGFPPQPFRLATDEPLDPSDRPAATSAFAARPFEPSGRPLEPSAGIETEPDRPSERRQFNGTAFVDEPAASTGPALDTGGETAVRRTAFESADGPAAEPASSGAAAEPPVEPADAFNTPDTGESEADPVVSSPSDSAPASGAPQAASGGLERASAAADPVAAALPVGTQVSRLTDTPPNAEPNAEPGAEALGGAAAAALSAFSSPGGPPAETGARSPRAFAPPPPPAASPDPAFDDPEAPIPVGTTASGSGGPTGPAASSSDAGPTRGPERLAAANGIRGFGMAPAISPPLPPASPSAGVGTDADSRPDSSREEPLAAADQGMPVGRPGPLQLEGVQTPQVALEKRGPREVQVGKVARYETIVRNVGAAIAREVTVHDAVPAGTRLVSTVPPAAPDDRGGLVWQIGDLPQGGEARVAMELIPVEEGEVGSVASVAFRADASVRSLSTRPDLRIEVQPPKPVLVGDAVEMSIELRNPGTGEATGIVLEGLLPEALAHAAGRELEFDVGRLRPGESRRIDLRLSSKLPGTHPLRLVARADAGIEVEEPLKVTITAPTLELSADMPGRRYLQRPATCILSMANGGTAPARSVELAAQLPEGLKFVRANNAGTFDEQTRRVIWHLEELPPGEVGSVELVLMPVALGPQRVAVAARALDGLSDQLVESIDVEGLAALAFQVSDSEDPVEVGGFTEYVVRVGNQGTKPASGVRVTVALLGDLEPIEASGPVRHRVENLSIVFDPLASLAPDEESVFRVRARGRRAGDQRVQVQVTSADTGTPITKEEVTRVYADD
jgi:uncharacterized repeat protein (TIGR01451 family)